MLWKDDILIIIKFLLFQIRIFFWVDTSSNADTNEEYYESSEEEEEGDRSVETILSEFEEQEAKKKQKTPWSTKGSLRTHIWKS